MQYSSPSKKFKAHDGLDWTYMYNHIKAFELSPFPHQRNTCVEGLLGQHTLCMLGRTQYIYPIRGTKGYRHCECWLFLLVNLDGIRHKI